MARPQRMVGRLRRHGSRVPRSAPLWKLGRILRAGPARSRRLSARHPCGSEDGSRATPRARDHRLRHGRPSTKPFETPIFFWCTWRTQGRWRCRSGSRAAARHLRPGTLPSLRRHQHQVRRELDVVPEYAGTTRSAAPARQRADGHRPHRRHHGRARLRHGDDPVDDEQAARAGHRLHRPCRHVAGDAGPRGQAHRPRQVRWPRSGAARRSGGCAARRGGSGPCRPRRSRHRHCLGTHAPRRRRQGWRCRDRRGGAVPDRASRDPAR